MNSSTRTYGALGPADGRPNGVVPVVVEQRTMPGSVEEGIADNPNLHDPAPGRLTQPSSDTTTSTELRPDVAEPPYGEPDRSANVLTRETQVQPTTPRRPISLPVLGSPPMGQSTAVTVQEFYSAQSAVSSSEERNVRWMSRFTEFMRVAANRSVNGFDRFMDNLGLPHGQQSTQTQNVNVHAGRAREGPMGFSPPEELPPASSRAMPPPTSWVSTSPQRPQPLFTQAQAAQLRQAHRDYPLVYGQSSEVGSDHSSRLQAEVQRQMDEYAMKYQEELRTLQGEVQRLRQERQEWETRVRVQATMGEYQSGRPSAPDQLPGNSSGPQGSLHLQEEYQSGRPSAPDQLPGNSSGPQGSLHLQEEYQSGRPSAPDPLPGNSSGPQGSLHLQEEYQSGRPSAPDQLPGNSSGPQGSLHLQGEYQSGRPSAPDQLPGNSGGPQGSLHLQGEYQSGRPSAPDQLRGNSGGPQGSLHLQGNNQSGRSSAPDQLRGNSGGPQGSLHLRTDQECDQDTGGHASYMSARTSGAIASGLTYEPKEGPTSTTDDSNVQPKASTSTATGTPSQWLGGTSPTDPMSLLAGGIAQLQAAMLTQLKDKEKDKPKEEDCSPETVKPGSSSLPSLPEVDPATSSVDVMDWLEVITTTMQDLSDGSAAWWIRVRALADESYQKWTHASPVEKLSIQPPRDEELETGRWSRVNSRGASMIMLALHDSVRQEMVQRRSTGSVTALVFRLLTIYQPGGQQEKVRILQNLQQPEPEYSAQKAVKSLRTWARWLRRCKELGVSAPDPSLLTRGLSTITKNVMEKDAEASFRTSLVKSHLSVDTKPSLESVEKYYHHLLAECETIAVSTSTITASTTTATGTPPNKAEPKIKPMRTERNSSNTTTTPPPTPAAPSRSSSQSTTRSEGDNGDKGQEDKSKVPCKFFGRTYKGCARAGRCPFMHSWDGLEKTGRCLACGGKNHSVKECPNKKAPTADASSATPSSQRTGTTRSSASSSTTNATSNKNVRIDENPQVEPIPARSSSTSASGGDQVDLKEVLADVGKMLKAMSATSLKAMRVATDKTKVEMDRMIKTVCEDGVSVEELTGLLDSGASHAMRPAKEDEYSEGLPVRVTLAGEDVRVLRQNNEGTILVQEENAVIQPIVPLGAVIENLGYTLHWTPKSLRLTHPEKQAIKVRIKNHCPEVAAADALSLIKELEMSQVNILNERVASLRARLEVIQKEEKRDWVELLREYSRTGAKPTLLKAILTSPVTRELPSEVQSLLVEGFNPHDGERYLKGLPITRRRRRALLSSRSWVVNLFSGEEIGKNDPFNEIPKAGKVVLDIDISKSKHWDIHRINGVYQVLLWAASEGRIADVIGSPPHHTWPTSMAPTRGPESYPVRTTSQPFGLKELTAAQKQKVDAETVCVAKQLMVWFLAQMNGQRDVGFLMEFPADCEKLRKDDPGRASVWSTEMWKSFRSVTGMKEVSFYLGAYGHKALRPTTIATTYPALIQIDKNYDFHDGCVPPSLLTRAQLRQWPKEFKDLVAESVKDYHSARWKDEEELVRAGVKLSKLTKEQREAWHRHLLNDHQPYRADCSVCINAQATGYQHRRRKHPTMYTMALDLAGPFKQKGRDMEHEDYKYIMVAAYRCPREYMSAKAIDELDSELYVPDDIDECVGDDPMEIVAEAVEKEPPSDPEKEPEEETSEPMGPETLDDAVEGLVQPEEWATIYVTRPLRGRTNHYVVQAAKEILLQLKQTGLHVEAIHTDRAREFKAKAFREWTVDSKVRHTKTAGADPSGNSSAELGIKWAKGRVRALLGASKAPPRDWPMAMQHASATVWAKAFPDSSWTTPPATAFGNEVWFRSKAYQGKKEKKHDAAGARWKKGLYRGPAMDVKRGHLIAREDGGLTVAKSVKFGVIEPDKEFEGLLSPAIGEGLHEDMLVNMEPSTRVELKEEIEFRARKLGEEKNYDICEVVTLYRLLENLGQPDTRFDKKSPMTSWYTGAFVHGGVAGVRSNVKEYPHTTKYLTEFAKHHCGEEVKFSALGVAKNAQLGLHRDSHNYQFSKNYVLPLQQFDHGSLWIQDDEVEKEECVTKQLPNGKVIRGRCLDMHRGRMVSFSPRLWHEVQPWKGERLVLLLYTPRSTKLPLEAVDILTEAGFNLDPASLAAPDEDTEGDQECDGLSAFSGARVKTIVAETVTKCGYAFVEIEDADLFQTEPFGVQHESSTEGLGQSLLYSTSHLKKIVKKAEVQYTPNIEDILGEIEQRGGQLEVTHTVSLADVKQNIEKWRPSALKEFTNLTKTKKAFTVKKRHELPPNCRIVPCKGVYTVKPDKAPPGYRRKQDLSHAATMSRRRRQPLTCSLQA